MSHPGTEGVEDARDANFDVQVSMEGDSQRLCVAFGLIVDRPGSDGIHITPVAFRLRVNRWVSIHFRGAGQKKSRIELLRQF